jgi:hypothetical protein
MTQNLCNLSMDLSPKPAVRVEESDANATLAVQIVYPRTIYFGRQFST